MGQAREKAGVGEVVAEGQTNDERRCRGRAFFKHFAEVGHIQKRSQRYKSKLFELDENQV